MFITALHSSSSSWMPSKSMIVDSPESTGCAGQSLNSEKGVYSSKRKRSSIDPGVNAGRQGFGDALAPMSREEGACKRHRSAWSSEAHTSAPSSAPSKQSSPRDGSAVDARPSRDFLVASGRPPTIDQHQAWGQGQPISTTTTSVEQRCDSSWVRVQTSYGFRFERREFEARGDREAGQLVGLGQCVPDQATTSLRGETCLEDVSRDSQLHGDPYTPPDSPVGMRQDEVAHASRPDDNLWMSIEGDHEMSSTSAAVGPGVRNADEPWTSHSYLQVKMLTPPLYGIAPPTYAHAPASPALVAPAGLDGSVGPLPTHGAPCTGYFVGPHA